MAMPPPPPVSHARLEEGRRPGGPPPDEPVSAFIVCMNVTNTVTHLLLGAVAFFAFIIANSLNVLNLPKFTAHIYLSVIGYVLLVSQAVLSLNPRSGWGDNLKYPQKTKIYWGLQVLGSLLALIGGVLAIVGVEEQVDSSFTIPGTGITIPLEINHLSSAHHIVGLVAMLLTGVSLVGGLANLICMNLVNSSILKSLYSCVMTLSLIIAFTAICLGFNTRGGDDSSTNMAVAFTVLALVGMLAMLIGNLTVARGKGIL